MKFIIYGGIDKIGGNKILIESEDKTRIFLDFGRCLDIVGSFYQEFIQPRQKNMLRDFLKLNLLPEIPNIYREELIKIDFSSLDEKARKYMPPTELAPDYWEYPDLINENEERPFVSGIFITHGHYDHIQDVSFLDPEIPVYCSDKTKLLIKSIMDISNLRIGEEFYYYNDYSLTSKSASYRTIFPYSLEIKKVNPEQNKKFIFKDPDLEVELTIPNSPKERKFNTINEEESINLGSLKIEAISVDHSVPGALSFLVTDEKTKKTILYSGDFRFGGESASKLEEYIRKIKKKTEKIDVFICEGTRIAENKINTEEQIEENLVEKMKNLENLILIDFNWKDLERLKTILNCCKKIGRILLISPKTAFLLFQFHQNYPDEYPNPINEENLKIYLKRKGNLLYSPNDYDKYSMGFFSKWGKNSAQKDLNLTRFKHMLDLKRSENDDSKIEYFEDMNKKNKKYFGNLLELQSKLFGNLDEEQQVDKLNMICELAFHHFKNGVRAYEVRDAPQKYVLMFSFWDVNELFDLSQVNGDMSGTFFIKANTEPFNDEMLIDEQKMINWLKYFKINYEAKLKNDGSNREIFLREHVSGHATGPEIKKIIAELKPNLVVPIHTENTGQFKEIVEKLRIKFRIPKYGESIDI
ncbi:MAG: MBL fold metallo-hydrolase RNA specificity domain-containing protein [Candidatus Helarchaeota archaeon]